MSGSFRTGGGVFGDMIQIRQKKRAREARAEERDECLGVAAFPGVEGFRIDDAYQLIEWRGHGLVQIPYLCLRATERTARPSSARVGTR